LNHIVALYFVGIGLIGLPPFTNELRRRMMGVPES
jgi:hypothetical protein